MTAEEKPLRADAERNRRRLLEVAAAMFSERGLDVGVGEIAERAGVGRGTLFRNFASKEDLIAAIVVERMNEVVALGRELLDTGDPGDTLFTFIEETAGRQQVDRAMFESVADTFMANEGIRAAYAAIVETVGLLLQRAQASGAVRADVSAVDVMMMVKGACQAATSFQMVDPEIGVARQLDLVRAALSAPAATRPLRGRTPSVEDLERAFPSSEPAAAHRARSAPA
jgi:AcrR family transcriptional regulator